ncbi:MAG: hypothetical protein A2015_05875 [Spirochaetes bacterium GWF1_31_7]|nr:MAG: hypothetical protein A2Y30_07835 [Spirochaetes bacterium GWE1_32_154]OHD50786.1 MAG: hypothetical protein A2Y29_02505 [Spirochaetes bacterium GWE2_31_10]OHD52723.1 MAG: hypothetical protein A2015_05875 [Spirochaetes bacterium GWF1_31_7]OHD78534.1 MAG: hypothetical protein A2355_15830 [Spirochaetes bacterium RIFOXYB1_FULL_32_8]HBD95397.1 hypothetical protein [Spirochaetia bacterium]
MPQQIWNEIIHDVQIAKINEPFLTGFLTMTILKHSNIFEALSYYLAEKLENNFISRLLQKSRLLDFFFRHMR